MFERAFAGIGAVWNVPNIFENENKSCNIDNDRSNVIMGARSALIKKIQYTAPSTKDLVRLLKDNEYSQTEGKGFKINDLKTTEISASYIYSQPSFVNTFDETTLDYKKEKTIIKNIVNFEIDLINQIFVIFGNSTISRRLLTEFGKISNFEIPVEDISFSPASILQRFESQKLSLKITTLRIRNFKVKADIIGTFSIKIIEPSVANTILTEYPGEVIYTSGTTEIHGKTVTLGFYENGTLVMSDLQEDNDEIFGRIKKLLFSEAV